MTTQLPTTPQERTQSLIESFLEKNPNSLKQEETVSKLIALNDFKSKLDALENLSETQIFIFIDKRLHELPNEDYSDFCVNNTTILKSVENIHSLGRNKDKSQ